MAQLRDKLTSEVVFEGTPLEVSTLANEIGVGEVLFDDTGHDFDPAACAKSYDDQLKGLDSNSNDTKLDAATKKASVDAAVELRTTIANAKKQKAKVTKAIQTAREAREQAMRNA